jgi:hypothetical protein
MSYGTPGGYRSDGRSSTPALATRGRADENTAAAFTPGAPLNRNSYFEKFLETRTTTRPIHLESEKLISDRATYISFLEAQLERVSSVVVSNDSIVERMNTQANMIQDMQDKVVALTQLIQMTQTYSEKQGQEAGTAVAALSSSIQTVASKVESHTSDFSRIQSEITLVASKQSEQDQQRSQIVAGMNQLHQEVSRVDARCDALIEVAKELEKATAPLDTVQHLTTEVARQAARVSEMLQLVTAAQRSAEQSRDTAIKAVDNATAAEASAINAMEQARSCSSNSHSAYHDARRALDEVQSCRNAALAAEASTQAALQVMVDTSMGKPVASASASLSSTMRSTATRAESAYGPDASASGLRVGDLNSSVISGAVHSAVAHVMDAMGSQVRTATQRIVATEQELTRLKSHVSECSDAINRSSRDTSETFARLAAEVDSKLTQTFSAAMEGAQSLLKSSEHHSASVTEESKRNITTVRDSLRDELRTLKLEVASATEDLRKGIHRAINRADEVGETWTAWEAAFSASHRELSETALINARTREAALDTDRRREHQEINEQLQEMRQTWEALRRKVGNFEHALFGAGESERRSQGGGSAPGSASPGLMNDLRAYTDEQLHTLRGAVENKIQEILDQYSNLSAQFLHADTEHKQLVRAADSLVSRWAQTNEAITDLQIQFADVKGALNSMESHASRRSPGSEATGSLNPRDIVRLVDSLVQPRMQDIAAELHQRVTEDMGTLSGQMSRTQSPSKPSGVSPQTVAQSQFTASLGHSKPATADTSTPDVAPFLHQRATPPTPPAGPSLEDVLASERATRAQEMSALRAAIADSVAETKALISGVFSSLPSKQEAAEPAKFASPTVNSTEVLMQTLIRQLANAEGQTSHAATANESVVSSRTWDPTATATSLGTSGSEHPPRIEPGVAALLVAAAQRPPVKVPVRPLRSSRGRDDRASSPVRATHSEAATLQSQHNAANKVSARQPSPSRSPSPTSPTSIHVKRSGSAEAHQRLKSSPGRHLNYRNDGNLVYSVQTQAGAGMQVHSHQELHCAKADRRPPVPTASKLGQMPSWYAKRASQLHITATPDPAAAAPRARATSKGSLASSGIRTSARHADPDSSAGGSRRSSAQRRRLHDQEFLLGESDDEVESLDLSRVHTKARGR